MYYFLLPYLAALVSVFFLPVLVDYLFLFFVAGLIGIVVLICRYYLKPETRYLQPIQLALHLLFYFAISLACLSAFALVKVQKILPVELESKDLVLQGHIAGLVKHEQFRQSFDFSISPSNTCDAVDNKHAHAELFLCHFYENEDRALPERLLANRWSDALANRVFLTGLIKTHPHKIKLSWYGKEKLQGGEFYQFKVKLKRPRASLNLQGFDYEGWLFAESYQAIGYVRSNGLYPSYAQAEKKSKGHQASALRERLRYLLLKDWLGENFPEKKPSQAAALLVALMLGDRSFLSAQTRDVLIKTGTAHLLAISGMHIGLLALIVFFICYQAIRCLNWLFLTFHTKTAGRLQHVPLLALSYRSSMFIAACASMLVALMYAILAGFSLPTQRALIMVCCYSMAIIVFDRPDFFKTWCFALLLVLLWNPLAILSAGFYLSFLAVLVIQWFLLSSKSVVEPASESGFLNSVGRKLWFSIKVMLKAQWAVFVGLAPVLLFIFSAFYPIALILNLFAVPWVSMLVLPLSLLALLMVTVNEAVAVFIFDWVIKLLEGLLLLLESAVQFSDLAVRIEIGFVAATCLFLFVLLWLSSLMRHFKLLSLLLLLPLFIDVGKAGRLREHIPDGEFILHMLDVGQGLALIVETQHHILVYDTGPSFGDFFDAGKAIVIPALEKKLSQKSLVGFQKNVDVMVLSHGHNDHIGGAHALLQMFKVAEIRAYAREPYFQNENSRHPFRLDDDSLNWQNCYQGQSWWRDGVNFTFVYPPDRLDLQNRNQRMISSRYANEQSCVLKVAGTSLSVLLTGDIEKAAEQYLATYGSAEDLQSNILIAPHHGSKTSSSMGFLQKVQPEQVLISAGYRNQFSHPHPEVMRRYEQLGISSFNTADLGEIVIRSWQKDADSWQFARQQKKRYWRPQ